MSPPAAQPPQQGGVFAKRHKYVDQVRPIPEASGATAAAVEGGASDGGMLRHAADHRGRRLRLPRGEVGGRSAAHDDERLPTRSY